MHREVIRKEKVKEIPSPCTGVCTMNVKNEYCIGCFRTRLEIGGWMHLSDDDKISVIKKARKRRRDHHEE